ncbi:MAG: HD domain-containing protein [Actinomycetota bacterium]|nr:HD domain-containing protein [Actinomycetota bacterium]
MTETLFQTTNGNGAAPKRTLRELEDGEALDCVFAVRERELRQKRNGESFLKVVLADKTGTVPAICWSDAQSLFELATPGAAVRVTGRFSLHSQYGKQIKIETIEAAVEGSYKPDELAEGPTVAPDRLEGDMRELLATIQDASLRALLERFFGAGTAAWERFRAAPAAKYYHQAYVGGLLEHTLSVAQAVSAASSFFPGIDRDVAVTGALLHDIGKTEAYNADPMAIDLTDKGRLLGEIPLGYYKVRREIEEIEGFDPALAQAVLHIILSHHGSLEHGSPVVPCTREATLVHTMDNLGGKLGSFDRLERELADGESWSRFDRGIDAAAFFGPRAA